MERNIVYKENNIHRSSHTMSMKIITSITFFIDSIIKKNTLNILSSKFMSFINKEMHTKNTTNVRRSKYERE